MSIFDLFRKKEEPEPTKRKNLYSFSDEDRQISADIRRKKAEYQLELERLHAEKEKIRLETEIADLRQQYEELTTEPEEEEPSNNTADALILTLLSGILKANNQSVPNPPVIHTQNNTQIPETGSLSDDKLKGIWVSIPDEYKKKAKKMKDNELKNFLKFQLPTASEEEILRAIRIIREN